MINFMLSQVAFILCLVPVVHTFCSDDLGRNGGDLLCGGIL